MQSPQNGADSAASKSPAASSSTLPPSPSPAAHAWPDVNLQSARDPGPRLCWTQCLGHLPDLQDRKRGGLSPAAARPPLKKPLLRLLAPRSVPSADGRVFVKNTAFNIGSFHIAPTQPITVIARKIKHKHIQKESTFPLPFITSLRPPLGGQPLETIQSLATRVEAW